MGIVCLACIENSFNVGLQNFFATEYLLVLCLRSTFEEVGSMQSISFGNRYLPTYHHN